MANLDTTLLRQRITEDIRRLVAACIESGDCLPIGHCASLLHKASPNAGLTAEEIGEEILRAAIGTGVPLELSRPDAPPTGKAA
jgi:hypothetical protein